MTKSLPEKLREANSKATSKCFGVGATVCTLRGCIADIDVCDAISVQAEELGDSCDGICLCKMLDIIADEIERDYVRIPQFKHYESRAAFVEYMHTLADRMCVTRVWNKVDKEEDEYFLTIYYEPKPKDTLEAIERDAGLYYGDYIAEHPHVTTQREMVLDLLRRQREVLGRGDE